MTARSYPPHITAFVESLGELDAARRAQLSRTLSGQPAYWLEGLIVQLGRQPADRQARMRLVAGLYGHLNRGSQDRTASDGRSLGELLGELRSSSAGSESTERRFLNLLGADDEALPTVLRQIATLLAGQRFDIDWLRLTHDLWFWNDRTSRAWAQDFYRVTTSRATGPATPTRGETA